MNETPNTPPDEQTTTVGEQPAVSPVPPAAPDQTTQLLGPDPTRVEADFCGHHLRASEASLREISARISKRSGVVHHCAACASSAAA